MSSNHRLAVIILVALVALTVAMVTIEQRASRSRNEAASWLADNGIAIRNGAVTLNDTSVDQDTLEHLASAGTVNELAFINCELDANAIEGFGGFEDIETLLVRESDTDIGKTVAVLSQLSSLHTLSVYGMTIDDDDLAELSRVPGLNTLSLNACRLSPNALEGLPTCRSLKCVTLVNASVEASHLRNLEECERLRVLYLSGTEIGNADLTLLQGTPRLEILDISQTHDSWDNLRFLGIHKQRILEGGRSGLNEIAAKYLWLATYHNSTVSGPLSRDIQLSGGRVEDFLISNTEMPLLHDVSKWTCDL